MGVVVLHCGLVGVRFTAVVAALPVYGVPFALTSVTTIDCVAEDTYAARRFAAAALFGGTVIVNRAVAVAAGPVFPVAGVPATLPRPPHPASSAAIAIASATRDRTYTGIPSSVCRVCGCSLAIFVDRLYAIVAVGTRS
jgi:hypothetical protein